MPQSLARLPIHLVFSTKHREPFLHQEIKNELHSYMAAVLSNLSCPAPIINSMPDHVHILFLLSRTVTVAKAVEDVKKSSSKSLKTQSPALANFSWQGGYGVFAVSESNVAKVCQSIERQEEHHRKLSFQDEYRGFLTKHGIEYDERYVWD